MITHGSFGDGCKENFIDPHGHYLRGSMPERLTAAFAEWLDVVPPLGFVRPVLDVLFGHWFSVDLLQT